MDTSEKPPAEVTPEPPTEVTPEPSAEVTRNSFDDMIEDSALLQDLSSNERDTLSTIDLELPLGELSGDAKILLGQHADQQQLTRENAVHLLMALMEESEQLCQGLSGQQRKEVVLEVFARLAADHFSDLVPYAHHMIDGFVKVTKGEFAVNVQKRAHSVRTFLARCMPCCST